MFASLSLGLALMPFIVSAKTFDVQVGGPNGTLEFVPPALSAAVGDQVIFHFNPKNHSVFQSSFDSPCGPKDGGFQSPFMFVAANSSVDSRPTYTVTVNDTNPVWVYCAQAANTPASHCGQGMVFAINCPSDDSPNSLGNFKKEALAIGASLSSSAAAASATAGGSGGYGGYGGGSAGSAGSPTLTAAYGDVTIPPAPSATLVTAEITLDSSSIWTTVYTSFVNSPAATPVAVDGAVHTVVVGGTGKLFFDPDHIIANPRDQVVFQFQQKNHSVIQSSFPDPCRPLNSLNATAPPGFNSGFHAVDANQTDGFPTWTLTVNDTSPVWAYCGQTAPSSHCGAGMVFSINAVDNSTRDFDAFKSVAESLNGTGSASGSGAAPSQTGNTGGALSLRVGGGASVVMALIAVAASLL
jgi:plastocyanin